MSEYATHMARIEKAREPDCEPGQAKALLDHVKTDLQTNGKELSEAERRTLLSARDEAVEVVVDNLRSQLQS